VSAVFLGPVVNRIKYRLSGWRSRYLSFGGCLVLLKFVLTALPVYALEALLGKWCWRLLVDRGGLWYRVLVVRYGVRDGRLADGGRSGSIWWREVSRIRDGNGGGSDGWFEGCVIRRVGDGESTLFWHDWWCGDIPFRIRFNRLFDLVLNKSIIVKDMFSLGWGASGVGWQWCRALWVWDEELLEECRLVLSNVSLQPLSYDVWQWQPDSNDGYSVRGVYDMLTTKEMLLGGQCDYLVWHKQVPLKVSIFAWRLLRDRLPTKSNLVSRGILDVEASLCVSGCGNVEDARHLFLECSCFGSLWPLVRSWIGFDGDDHCDILNHCAQFSYYTGGLKSRRSFLQLIWLLTMWVICNERNNRLFKQKENSIAHLLDKVKYHSLWWSSPLSCLGIGNHLL